MSERLLHLFALAPVGSRPAVAFEITTAGEAGVGQAGIAGEQVASLTISPWSGGELEVEGPAGTVVEVPDWGTVTIVEPEAGEDGDGPRAPLRIQTLTDFPVVDESQV